MNMDFLMKIKILHERFYDLVSEAEKELLLKAFNLDLFKKLRILKYKNGGKR